MYRITITLIIDYIDAEFTRTLSTYDAFYFVFLDLCIFTGTYLNFFKGGLVQYFPLWMNCNNLVRIQLFILRHLNLSDTFGF